MTEQKVSLKGCNQTVKQNKKKKKVNASGMRRSFDTLPEKLAKNAARFLHIWL